MSDRVNNAGEWDERVALYERIAEPFTSLFAAAAFERAGVKANAHVLDVAAGTGALSLIAAKAHARVTAIDFSSAMAARVGEKLAQLSNTHNAMTMDGQALAFPDAHFDAAFSVFGVMMFPDFRAGLCEMARVTKPGGVVAIAVWASPHGAGPALVFAQAYRDLYPDRPAPPVLEGMRHLSHPAGMRADLEAVGLREIAITPLHHEWVMPTPTWIRDEAEFAFQQFSLWQELPTTERRAFLAHLDRMRVDVVPSSALIGVGMRT